MKATRTLTANCCKMPYLPSIKIRQCLVPRTEIEAVELKMPMTEVRKRFEETKLSKLIVFEGNIDNIVGYAHQLDLFKKPVSLNSILLPISVIPESMNATDLINKFSKEHKTIAWVVDEFGGTAGIITMEDLLEEIFGDIQDEYDTEEFIEKQLADNEFIFLVVLNLIISPKSITSNSPSMAQKHFRVTSLPNTRLFHARKSELSSTNMSSTLLT